MSARELVGPEGFYYAFLQDGFSRGRKISLLHESAGWQGVLEWWGIPRDCSAREDRFLHILFRPEGNKVEPAQYGIEHEAMPDVRLCGRLATVEETKIYKVKGPEVRDADYRTKQLLWINPVSVQL